MADNTGGVGVGVGVGGVGGQKRRRDDIDVDDFSLSHDDDDDNNHHKKKKQSQVSHSSSPVHLHLQPEISTQRLKAVMRTLMSLQMQHDVQPPPSSNATMTTTDISSLLSDLLTSSSAALATSQQQNNNNNNNNNRQLTSPLLAYALRILAKTQHHNIEPAILSKLTTLATSSSSALIPALMAYLLPYKSKHDTLSELATFLALNSCEDESMMDVAVRVAPLHVLKALSSVENDASSATLRRWTNQLASGSQAVSANERVKSAAEAGSYGIADPPPPPLAEALASAILADKSTRTTPALKELVAAATAWAGPPGIRTSLKLAAATAEEASTPRVDAITVPGGDAGNTAIEEEAAAPAEILPIWRGEVQKSGAGMGVATAVAHRLSMESRAASAPWPPKLSVDQRVRVEHALGRYNATDVTKRAVYVLRRDDENSTQSDGAAALSSYLETKDRAGVANLGEGFSVFLLAASNKTVREVFGATSQGVVYGAVLPSSG
ncbi:hypothetical protein PPROV_000110300 [Pycnococcus provasolii]|uniref:Spen paralogue and orthologue SPOC C-terminal domain-containing protein n=1 Tax=Pycnococcus provasolii TaxID=41880 RepID=A0A830H592_9CHLO|nr:hypothetical protein PPROV_000110300 [Pycnococcus provasolii]